MTLSLIHFVHVQFSQCKYALTRFTFTGLAPGVSGKTEEATAIRISHKSPFPHVMSVLQDAAPRAFGTCLLNANGNLDISINFVICVSRHFEFGSGHTQEGACQRALHQFVSCA
jgi:hypothetical protein